MLEKLKRLKRKTNTLIKHKKKLRGVSEKPQGSDHSIAIKGNQSQTEEQNGNDAKIKKIRRVNLTTEQIELKIKGLKEKVAALTGKENKNKRTRIYNEISRLNKAISNPDVYKKDPVEEARKRQEDLQKRIEKKKAKKTELLKLVTLQKKYSAKVICFICKGKGHQAKDCTQSNLEVEGVDMNATICYNCGSNQHTLKNCRKKKKESLPFAVCFVCKEVGHIARDCQQNEKGLYAHGGGCYICNSVRHVAKDCPDSEENRRKAEAKNAEKGEAPVEKAASIKGKNKIKEKKIKKEKKSSKGEPPKQKNMKKRVNQGKVPVKEQEPEMDE